MIKAVLFDLGDTLIHERVDEVMMLDKMTLHLQKNAKEALEGISLHFKIGLITDTESSTESSVRIALNKLGIESFFSAIVTSTSFGKTKPHPDIYHEVLNRLGVTPKESVMVGNDLTHDILGAKKLGLITILYRSSSSYQKGFEKYADYHIDSLEELFDIVIKLKG